MAAPGRAVPNAARAGLPRPGSAATCIRSARRLCLAGTAQAAQCAALGVDLTDAAYTLANTLPSIISVPLSMKSKHSGFLSQFVNLTVERTKASGEDVVLARRACSDTYVLV